MAHRVQSMAPGRTGFDVLADQVAAAMQQQDMNVSELAGRTGVPRPILSYWLNGRRPMRADYLAVVLAELALAITPTTARRS